MSGTTVALPDETMEAIRFPLCPQPNVRWGRLRSSWRQSHTGARGCKTKINCEAWSRGDVRLLTRMRHQAARVQTAADFVLPAATLSNMPSSAQRAEKSSFSGRVEKVGLTAPPPPPGSAPPIPNGGECSKTSPCAHPERLPSGASNPSQKGQTYRTDRALPTPVISCATNDLEQTVYKGRELWYHWTLTKGSNRMPGLLAHPNAARALFLPARQGDAAPGQEGRASLPSPFGRSRKTAGNAAASG